jgi:hypothetical protein
MTTSFNNCTHHKTIKIFVVSLVCIMLNAGCSRYEAIKAEFDQMTDQQMLTSKRQKATDFLAQGGQFVFRLHDDKPGKDETEVLLPLLQASELKYNITWYAVPEENNLKWAKMIVVEMPKHADAQEKFIADIATADLKYDGTIQCQYGYRWLEIKMIDPEVTKQMTEFEAKFKAQQDKK